MNLSDGIKTLSRSAVFICVTLVFASVAHAHDRSSKAPALQSHLTTIVERFFRAYEPQMQSVEQATQMSIEPFTSAKDFTFIVDGRDLSTYDDFLVNAPKSIAQQYKEVASAKHPISNISFSKLGDGGAVMTVFYRTYFVETNGKKSYQDAVATIAFRKEKEGWKFVQYHGRHGNAVYADN